MSYNIVEKMNWLIGQIRCLKDKDLIGCSDLPDCPEIIEIKEDISELQENKFDKPQGNNSEYLDGTGTPTQFPTINDGKLFANSSETTLLGGIDVSTTGGDFSANKSNNTNLYFTINSLTLDAITKGEEAFNNMPTDISDLTDSQNKLFDGNYSSLTNKPTIPEDVSELTDTTGRFFDRDYNSLSNLPDLSALAEIIYADDYSSLPAVGEDFKVYITKDTGYMYRWNGTGYTQLTDQTAIWGQISGTLTSQPDLNNALNSKEDKSNKKTSIGASPNNTDYPTNKAVADYVGNQIQQINFPVESVNTVTGQVTVSLENRETNLYKGSIRATVTDGTTTVPSSEIRLSSLVVPSDAPNDGLGGFQVEKYADVLGSAAVGFSLKRLNIGLPKSLEFAVRDTLVFDGLTGLELLEIAIRGRKPNNTTSSWDIIATRDWVNHYISQLSTSLSNKVNAQGNAQNLWSGTQAQYDAIAVKNPQTVYVIEP